MKLLQYIKNLLNYKGGRMKVKLLNYTPDPEKTVYLAARQCLSQNFPKKGEKKDWEKLIRFLIIHQHFSPFKHISFIFSVQGISRVCSHQLVRHRLASYSQQSQRRTKLIFDFIVPSSIEKNPKTMLLWKNYMLRAYQTYMDFQRLGIPLEDARYILPQSIATHLVVTMNARELFHFFEERLCGKSQWEIRQLANKMLLLCRKVSLPIFDWCGPRCTRLKYCPEGKPCKYYYFWK